MDSVSKLPPADGHSDVRVVGTWSASDHVTGEPGDFIVRGAQPLGVLAVILLEPMCDDGLVAWNYFDAALDADDEVGRRLVPRVPGRAGSAAR